MVRLGGEDAERGLASGQSEELDAPNLASLPKFAAGGGDDGGQGDFVALWVTKSPRARWTSLVSLRGSTES